MKKQFKEEIVIKKLMADAGLEKPSAAFSANVLNALPVRKVIAEYKPLINLNGWMIIGSLLVFTAAGLYFINSDLTINLDYSLVKTVSFPDLNISRTMSYAIGFLSLFLLQIPFLKNLMERQFRY